MKIIVTIFFLLFSFKFVNAAEFKGKFLQGSFILGITEPGSKVTIDKTKVKVSKDGYFAFGLSRDRKNNVIIKIFKDQKLEIIEKKVLKKKI